MAPLKDSKTQGIVFIFWTGLIILQAHFTTADNVHEIKCPQKIPSNPDKYVKCFDGCAKTTLTLESGEKIKVEGCNEPIECLLEYFDLGEEGCHSASGEDIRKQCPDDIHRTLVTMGIKLESNGSDSSLRSQEEKLPSNLKKIKTCVRYGASDRPSISFSGIGLMVITSVVIGATTF